MEWLRGSSASPDESSLFSDDSATTSSTSTHRPTSLTIEPSGWRGSSSSSSKPLLSLSSSSLPLSSSPSSSPLATVSTSILSRSTGKLTRRSCPFPSLTATCPDPSMSPASRCNGTNPARSSQSSCTTSTAGMPSGSLPRLSG